MRMTKPPVRGLDGNIYTHDHDPYHPQTYPGQRLVEIERTADPVRAGELVKSAPLWAIACEYIDGKLCNIIVAYQYAECPTATDGQRANC